MDLNVFIVTNGPGEISTWVIPVVDALRQHLPDVRIIIGLVPCPHSSGYEGRVASQLYGTTVLQPQEMVQFVTTGRLPSHVAIAKEGVVLHLGGDQLFSVGVGWRTRFPVITYTEDKALWPQWTNRYLIRDQQSYLRHRRRGVPDKKLFVIGDLMADAVRPSLSSTEVRKKLKLSAQAPVVSLLPGSKPLKVLYTTSFLLKIAEKIQQRMPETQFILPQSPYTPLSQLRQAIQDEAYYGVLQGVPGRIMHDNQGTFIATEQVPRVHITPPSWHYNALQISDLSITLPGTNTAELAALGIPMVVLLPLNRPDLLPLDGLLGQANRIPFVGKWMASWAVNGMLRKLKFVAIPNQKLQQAVVPEFIGNIDPEQVAEKAIQLLGDPYHRREVGMSLKACMRSENTTQQVLQHIVAVLAQQYPHHQALLADYPVTHCSDPWLDSDSASNQEHKHSN